MNAMHNFFNGIVFLFQEICRFTGLKYSELNILVYLLCIPFSWAVIVAAKSRKYLFLPVLHFFITAGYLYFGEMLSGFSRELYDRHIDFLEYLGKNTFDGYIVWSLLAGIVFPVGMYGALMLAKKPVWFYVCFLLGLMGYEVYVWMR